MFGPLFGVKTVITDDHCHNALDEAIGSLGV